MIVAIILGLLLGVIVYWIAALFLPAIVALLLGVLVFVLVVFGGHGRLA